MKFYKQFLLVPVVLVIFSYLFYSTYKDDRDRAFTEFNNQQFAQAKQASISIESFFTYYRYELQFLSEFSNISPLNDKGRSLLADFYNNHSEEIKAISIIDSKGILKYTFPLNESAIGKEVSNQEHVRVNINNHKPTISDVFTSVQGYKTIAYHVPIIRGDEYSGSLVILLPLENLGRRFTEYITTGKTGYGWVISQEGVELFNPVTGQTGRSIKEMYGKVPSVLDLIDKTSKEKEGITKCLLPSNADNLNDLTKTLTAFYRVPLENTFWTIIISTPEKEVYATLTSSRYRLYIFITLIIIVTAAFIYMIIKTSSRIKERRFVNREIV
jgi:hypothetical protein